MIILDTNVISELMRPEPDGRVLDWLARNGTQEFCATSISLAEIMSGIAALPHGRRRNVLDASAQHVFTQAFKRILPFNVESAPHFASVTAARKSKGFHIDVPDAMIAAIALSHGAEVATRNADDFVGCGLIVRNPWVEP